MVLVLSRDLARPRNQTVIVTLHVGTHQVELSYCQVCSHRALWLGIYNDFCLSHDLARPCNQSIK